MFPGRYNYEYRYFSRPRIGDTLSEFKSRQYDSMLEKLNRENEYLSKNVIELIRENTRLKTQYSSRFRSDLQPRNRSYQRNNQKSKEQRYVTPPPKTEKKSSIPYNAEGTTAQHKVNQNVTTYPRSYKAFSTHKQTQQKAHESTWYKTPSPSFIEQLSEKNFESSSKNRQTSQSKSKRGLLLTKEIIQRESPHKESSINCSEIQVQRTANVETNRQIVDNSHDLKHVNPKVILEDLKVGLKEVRSKYELYPPGKPVVERKIQYSPERRVQQSPPKVTITYSNRQQPPIKHAREVKQESEKFPQSKKDNRPYILKTLQEDEEYETGERTNKAYIPITPKFNSTSSTQPCLFRHYY